MRAWLLWTSGALVGAALVATPACGGGDSNATGGKGGGGGPEGGGGAATTSSSSSGVGGAGGSPSTGGSGQGGSGGMFVPMCETTPNDTIFAMDNLTFGANSSTAWKTIGFDLDGIDSMSDCSQQCTINSHGSASKECNDGMNGIDNTFGEVIVPFLKANNINIDDQANMAIQMGEFTIMLDFAGLTADADQGPLVMKLYNGGNLEGTPKFDGTDCWPVTPESLTNKTDITSAKASFTMTQIAGNQVMSGTINVLPLSIATSIGPISINVRAARLEFDLTPGHDGVMQGFVGGVLDEGEFLDTIQGAIYAKFGPVIGKAACHMGDTTIEGAVDIMDDGSAGLGSTCNGISFGVGFTAKPVSFGGIGPATPPTTNMCPAN
jgi:hypothetical protein